MAGAPEELPEQLRKQIEEALAKGQADRLPNKPPARPPRFTLPRLPDPRPRTPKDLLLVGLLLALAGWMFRFPFSQPVLYVGLVCTAIALLSMLVRPHGSAPRYWRGRPIDSPPTNWLDRLYRLLYRG
jgi:hypothetical protein